ncbi:MAG: hypothetical protein AVDCRST_MAG28-4264 [uncultured Rubrobacteraceae bacterium]|uniref:SseB protein N-terminal domain-containing protein n=1 Tax=uncultured Rubrobacteraceae bacterium TaxID=349277 RepID=A0A6J4R973_9ACTN|nr:MAG: hypothetical protein AVDCRST_MAG28-4264 [uncultured Rubrobacteraceae bacterium]
MTPMETNQSRPTAERTSCLPPGPGSYWLIAKGHNNRIEVLTLCCNGEGEVVPIFSFEEEAEIFLGPRGAADGWQVRESSAGELVSVLYGPCARVKEVALDPLPEMVTERSVGLVSLLRERFVDLVIARIGEPLSLWESEERGRPDRCPEVIV